MTCGLQVASCAFLRLGCRSDQHALFSPSYARSNKKRSAKLLRCFPHCCPDHVPRSYCGCSLHVLVTFESAAAAAAAGQNAALTVCARFESAAAVAVSGAGDVVTALPLDAIVALPGGVLAPSGLTATESDWVRAQKASDAYQQRFPENTILFVLNNHRNPQWYYGYESGSTKAQREMRHVLAAYVLLLHPSPVRRSTESDGSTMDNPSPVARLATVVARLASPSFRMVSYRRQNDVRRTTRPRTLREEATADIVASDDGEDGVVRVGAVAVAVEDTASPTPFRNRVVSTVDTSSTTSLGFQTEAVQQSRSEIEYREALQTVYRCRDSGELPSWTQAGVDEEKDATISSPERETESTLPSLAPPLGLPSPRPTPLCLICREPLALHRHTPRRDIVDLLQPLLLLLVFMRATPLSSFAFYFGPMDFRIQRRWLAKIPPVDPSHSLNICADTAARTLVADVASTFSLAHFTPGGVLSGVGAVVKDALHEQMVLRSCADLLLDAFSSQRVQQILSMVTTAAAEVPHEGPASANLLCDPCERFSRLVSDLFDELTLLLVARSNNDLHFGDQFHSGHVSIPSLADDVLSLIDAESKYRALRGHASALLLRTDESLETAVQELFWSFVAHLEQVHELPRKLAVDGDEASAKRVLTVDKWTKVSVARAQSGLENSTSKRGADFTSWESRLSRCWCRRWFLAPTSVSVVPLSAASGDTTTSIDASNPFSVCGPSLLSVVAFVRMVSGVDVDLEGTRLVIGAAMSDMAPQMSMAPKMVLELDGRTHAFDSLPNGLSPVVGAAVFGGSLGASVYEGRVAGSGESLEVLLFDLPKAFPQSKTTNRLMVGGGTTSAAGTTLMIRRVRVRLAMDEAWSTGESCLSVFVEVSVVPYVSPQRLRQRHEWLAMVAAGRFRDEISVLRWTPVMEVQASFVGLR